LSVDGISHPQGFGTVQALKPLSGALDARIRVVEKHLAVDIQKEPDWDLFRETVSWPMSIMTYSIPVKEANKDPCRESKASPKNMGVNGQTKR
jgi:hypothetical protein